MKQKVICIVNNKGGVGKTTTAVNLAAGLVRKGKKVLLIDLDGQANMTTGLAIPYNAGPDAYDTILKVRKYTQAVKLNDLLYIIPGSRRTALMDMEKDTEAVVKVFLKAAGKDTDFDYVIFDCPPSLGKVTTAVMVAADYLLIPMRPDYYSMLGLSRIINMANSITEDYNPYLKLAGILITGYDGRKVSHRQISDTIGTMGYPIFQTRIRENVALTDAPAAGLDIFAYSPQSNGAADYESFCNEFLNFINTQNYENV